MMATLRCNHPDIEAFIDAKRQTDTLQRFNLSVLITDAFMRAVKDDADWPLVFPERDAEGSDRSGQVDRIWSGSTTSIACRLWKVVRARELWRQLCESAYDCAEPGVLFIDRINAEPNTRRKLQGFRGARAGKRSICRIRGRPISGSALHSTPADRNSRGDSPTRHP